MKKIITISILVLGIAACHRKTAAPSSTANTTTPPTEAPKVDAAHAEMVSQGKTVYTNRCGRCHALKNTADFTPQRWEGILKSMIPKAKLNETEAQQVTAYVMDNAKKS